MELIDVIEATKTEITGKLEDLQDEIEGILLSLEDFKLKTKATLDEIDSKLTSVQHLGAIV